jgi:hypothetical protein
MTTYVVVGILLLLLVLGIRPALRGTASAFESPTRRRNHKRDNRDMVRLLVLLVVAFGVMFAWKLGGA